MHVRVCVCVRACVHVHVCVCGGGRLVSVGELVGMHVCVCLCVYDNHQVSLL